MRADRPSARRLLAVTLSAAVVTASAVALARDWSAGMLRGTVLIIEGSEWREVEAGAVVSRESADFFVDMLDRVLDEGW